MRAGEAIYRWTAPRSRNPLVAGALTFTAPRHFVRSIYQGNAHREYWPGNRGCLTLSFDCDYPEDVVALPALLEMLGRHSFKASFACVGAWIERYPREHHQILESGHEILNHTYSHPDNELLNPGRKFRDIPAEQKYEEIERCHEIARRVLGYEPVGCRIPHFKTLFTPDIYGLLQRAGYRYSSSTWLTGTLSHGLPFLGPCGVVEFPLSVCPSHPCTVFDTWHSLNTPRFAHRVKHRGPEDYADLFRWLVNVGVETGSYINLYVDPLDVKGIPAFESLLRLISESPLLVATYRDYLEAGHPVVRELA